MKQLIFIIFLSLLFLSCKNSTKKPNNLLSENQMVEILEDVYLHKQQAYLVETEINAIDLKNIDAQIIVKHNATIPQFKESFQYYVLQPDMYNRILNDVRTNLEEKLPKEEREKRINERKEIKNK